MFNENRYKKLRKLAAKLNKERKKQEDKIDILCNDLIEAQRCFIKRLSAIRFSADFYEELIGKKDLNGLLNTAGELLKAETGDAEISFFLREDNGFKLYMAESDEPIGLGKKHLENLFSPELVENICNANKVCNLERLIEIGLPLNPIVVNKISVFTLPLSSGGVSLGFILLYRLSEKSFTDTLIHSISLITPGLAKAILVCQKTSQLVD